MWFKIAEGSIDVLAICRCSVPHITVNGHTCVLYTGREYCDNANAFQTASYEFLHVTM